MLLHDETTGQNDYAVCHLKPPTKNGLVVESAVLFVQHASASGASADLNRALDLFLTQYRAAKDGSKTVLHFESMWLIELID
jgi:hypothetical protein